jgi:8-oxo-dGTP pyrophosphatase MutT (NUDIX family)
MLKTMTSMDNHPISARPASTIVLVREHEQKLQVYLLRRSTKSGFFPGSYVFPGGALNPDERDVEFWEKHIDLPAEELRKIFGSGMDVPGIIAYGVAAIRETFEEAGVLLVRKKNDGDESFGKIGERPSPSELDNGWFHQRVSDKGWLLSFSNLFPWSHWITPEAMPKRFDTRFFVTLMPKDQECLPDDRETVHGLWVSPIQGLQGNKQGDIPLSPPTLVTLHQLLSFESLDSLVREIRSRSWGDPIQPIQINLDKGVVIVEPWDSHYGKQIEIDPESLAGKVLPVGEPCSRLWLNQGIWRPVSI